LGLSRSGRPIGTLSPSST